MFYLYFLICFYLLFVYFNIKKKSNVKNLHFSLFLINFYLKLQNNFKISKKKIKIFLIISFSAKAFSDRFVL